MRDQIILFHLFFIAQRPLPLNQFQILKVATAVSRHWGGRWPSSLRSFPEKEIRYESIINHIALQYE